MTEADNSRSKPATVVLLPTYNEAENLLAMIAAIHEQLPHTDVLVIDDNSPDGTGQLADQAAAEHDYVKVIHRPGKQGLGVAYRFAYREALNRGYERIIQMDCDFSHDPKDLPRIFSELDRYPVVVGSRRVPGGGCDGWAWYRNLLSQGGSHYARIILESPIHDLTSGFKAFRAEALGKLPIEDLKMDGYGFQIEVSSHLVGLGFKVHEMPIRFTDRQYGESKMTTKIMVEAMAMVWRIRHSMNQLYR